MVTGLKGKPGFHSTCAACGKRSFATRKLAKDMARQVDRTMRVYQCDGSGAWHMGHLPDAVIQGDIDRRTIYQREDSPDDVQGM